MVERRRAADIEAGSVGTPAPGGSTKDGGREYGRPSPGGGSLWRHWRLPFGARGGGVGGGGAGGLRGVCTSSFCCRTPQARCVSILVLLFVLFSVHWLLTEPYCLDECLPLSSPPPTHGKMQGQEQRQGHPLPYHVSRAPVPPGLFIGDGAAYSGRVAENTAGASTGGALPFASVAPQRLVFLAVVSACNPQSPRHGRQQRDVIRATWGKTAAALGVRYRFFLGRARGACGGAVAEEQRESGGDVVVLEGLEDSYRNLTLKTVSIFDWATRAGIAGGKSGMPGMPGMPGKKRQGVGKGEAGEGEDAGVDDAEGGTGGKDSGESGGAPAYGAVAFVAKVDDDVYLDVGALVHRLRAVPRHLQERGIYLGHIQYGPQGGAGSKVIRSKDHKWGDPTFPLPAYPPYASGPFYVMSSHVVQYLARTFRAGDLNLGWRNEDASVGSWLMPTNVVKVDDPGYVLVCVNVNRLSLCT